MPWQELVRAIGELSALGLLLAGYGYWRDHKREKRDDDSASAMASLRSQMTKEHDAVLSLMAKNYDGVNAQIKDIVNSFADNYMPRRESEQGMRAISEQLTDVRKDIGAVGNQVMAVNQRVDEIFTKVEFRRTPR